MTFNLKLIERATLRILGLGLIVASCGGSSATPSSPNGTLGPQAPSVLLRESFRFQAPRFITSWTVDVPAPGVLRASVDWTVPTNSFGLYLTAGRCPSPGTGFSGWLAASSTSTTPKPKSIQYTASLAAPVCVIVSYDSGAGPESFSVEATLTRF